jgi:hypothetical protein
MAIERVLGRLSDRRGCMSIVVLEIENALLGYVALDEF